MLKGVPMLAAISMLRMLAGVSLAILVRMLRVVPLAILVRMLTGNAVGEGGSDADGGAGAGGDFNASDAGGGFVG